MNKHYVLVALDSYEQDPNGEHCDALCDAAEFLGLDNGQYSADWLRDRVEEKLADEGWSADDDDDDDDDD